MEFATISPSDKLLLINSVPAIQLSDGIYYIKFTAKGNMFLEDMNNSSKRRMAYFSR
nr:MAG TPA: hypothetical protein [Caudoviricetes sp.]